MATGKLARDLVAPHIDRLLRSLLRSRSHQVIANTPRFGFPMGARHFGIEGEVGSNSKMFNLKAAGIIEDSNKHDGGGVPVVDVTARKVMLKLPNQMQWEEQHIGNISSKVCEIIQKEPEWEMTLLTRFPPTQHQDLFQPSCLSMVLSSLSIVDSNVALRYFIWLVSQDSFCPDISTSTAIFHVLMDIRFWKAAIYAIQSIKCRPDPSSAEFFLHLLCECLALDEALEAIPIIKDNFGKMPSVSTLSSFCWQSLRIGRTELVWQFYEWMIESGATADVSTVGCLMQTLCMEKRFFEAYGLVHQVSRDGIFPDTFSFNRLVSGFCKEGNFEMVSEVLHLMILARRLPEMCTYQEVLHALCDHGMGAEAFRVFNDLKRRGYNPSVITYNTMIDGLYKMRRMDDAQALLQEMIVKGVEPNKRTYTILVAGYSKLGIMDEAWKVYNEMVAKGFGESTIACNSMLFGFCRMGNMDDALGLFEDMRKKHIKRDIITYNTLIQGLCKEGNVLEASGLLRELLQSDLQPSESSYTYLIWSLCEQGNVDEAMELFIDMENKGLTPLVITRDYIISGLCKAGNVDEGLLWLSNMVRDNLKPSELTFNRVIGSLISANRVDDVFLVLNLMFQFGHSLKGCICSSIIHHLCHGSYNLAEKNLVGILGTA